jgi:Tfp pilus assembly protein PilF
MTYSRSSSWPLLRRSQRDPRPCGARLLAFLLVMLAMASPAAAKKEPTKQQSAKVKLAQNYYLNNRLAEALSTVDDVLKQDPKYIEARQLRGQILFGLDAVDDALGEFDRVLELDKGYTEGRNWRAFALVQLGRYEEAMTEYDIALKDLTYPTPEKIHGNKGMLYRLMKQNDKAIASLEESIRLNPSYVKGFYELGVTWSLSGDQEKARRHFENVIKMAPDAPEARMARERLDRMAAAPS